MKTLFLTVILISVIISTAGGYWFGKTRPNTGTNDTSQNEVTLEYKPITLNGIAEDEVKRIESFVSEFEGYKFQKDPDKLLGMFTRPETKEEQKALDFILWKDYEQNSTKALSRLFSTQGYNHSVGGHYVRSIKKNGESIVVAIDELRIFYVGLGEDFIGYSAKVVNLVLEIKGGDAGYKIVRYYHSSVPGQTLKYEGFFAD